MPFFTDYNSLLQGGSAWHNGSQNITYNFINGTMPSYYSYDAFDDEYDFGGYSLPASNDFGLDASEQALMLQAIAAWNEVANTNMVAGGGLASDINFGSTAFGDTGLFGFAYFPDPGNLGGGNSLAGDVWLNTDNTSQYIPGVGPAFGHTSWNTLLHELGHALGLSHPNNDPSNAATPGEFTVMSYLPHTSEAGDSFSNQAWALTPMVWDIQAIQALYGVDTSTRAGNSVYFGDGGGTSGSAFYQYASSNMMVTGADGTNRDVILTIWDAGGTDLIDASDLSTNSQIDLRPGMFSTIGNTDNNIAVAAAAEVNGSVINYIENAWGGSGNDRLFGNATANTLLGNGGNDTLKGYSGDDELLGNLGKDKLYGGNGSDDLKGNNGKDRLWGDKGDDTLNGNKHNDKLNGGNGNDSLNGGKGNDTLNGGKGKDTLDGSNGNDMLTGGGSADTFVFSKGADIVTDFNVASSAEVVDLSGVGSITGFNDLVNNHLSEVGGNTIITDQAGNTMQLNGISISDLSASDFIF